MTKVRSILTILPGLLVILAGPVAAREKIQQSLNVPAQFSASIQAAQCTSSPGPQITLAGSLMINPLNVGVIFSHVQGSGNQQGVEVAKMVIPPNAPPTAAPQQSVVGALSSNPFLWLQLTDAKGQALTSEVFLGRCDQGMFNPMINLSLPSTVTGTVSADSCDASTGPVVTLDGQLETSPIHAKVIFRSSNDLGVGALRPAESSIDVLILPQGPSFLLPQDQSLAGTGGNPIVSTQFKLGDGTAIGIEQNYGRCSTIVNVK